VLTNLGKPWLPASINVVLRNPVYLGHTFWATTKIVKGANGKAKIVARPQDEWVFQENSHEALISRKSGTWSSRSSRPGPRSRARRA
jgi:hypothetical protein